MRRGQFITNRMFSVVVWIVRHWCPVISKTVTVPRPRTTSSEDVVCTWDDMSRRLMNGRRRPVSATRLVPSAKYHSVTRTDVHLRTLLVAGECSCGHIIYRRGVWTCAGVLKLLADAPYSSELQKYCRHEINTWELAFWQLCLSVNEQLDRVLLRLKMFRFSEWHMASVMTPMVFIEFCWNSHAGW